MAGGGSHGHQSARDGGGPMAARSPFRHATLDALRATFPTRPARGRKRSDCALVRFLPRSRSEWREVDHADISPCETEGALCRRKAPSVTQRWRIARHLSHACRAGQEEMRLRIRNLPPPFAKRMGGGGSRGHQSVRDGGGSVAGARRLPSRNADALRATFPTRAARGRRKCDCASKIFLPRSRSEWAEVDRTDISPCETVGEALPAEGPFRHATLSHCAPPSPRVPRGAGRNATAHPRSSSPVHEVDGRRWIARTSVRARRWGPFADARPLPSRNA
jgi:hypothetical protein